MGSCIDKLGEHVKTEDKRRIVQTIRSRLVPNENHTKFEAKKIPKIEENKEKYEAQYRIGITWPNIN